MPPAGAQARVETTIEPAEGTPLVYQCALPLSRQTLTFVADLLRAHLKKIGSRWRKLPPGKIALIVLATLRHDHRLADMAGGNSVSASTISRWTWEIIGLLAARAPRLDRALARIKKSFGEFIAWDAGLDKNDDGTALRRGAVAGAMALFDDFLPSTRPVLWRALLAEARLCKLLITAFEAHAVADSKEDRSQQLNADLPFTNKERTELDWTQLDIPDEQRVQLTGSSFQAVEGFLKDRLAPYGLYTSRMKAASGHASTPP